VDAEDERVIESSRGKLITENSDSELEFFETSARSGENVTEVRRILSVPKSLPLGTNTSHSVKICTFILQ